MKFKSALIFSLILHASLFFIAFIYSTGEPAKLNSTYTVSYISLSSKGGNGKGGIKRRRRAPVRVKEKKISVKNLTTPKKSRNKSKMRYPTKGKKKKRERTSYVSRKKAGEKADPIVEVSRRRPPRQTDNSTDKEVNGDDILLVGIGNNEGTGGYGSGNGSGGPPSEFVRYIEALKRRIREEWYENQFSSKSYRAIVGCKLNKEGHIAAVQMRKGSGNTFFDRNALSAVIGAAKKAANIRYDGDDLNSEAEYIIINFEFTWEK